MAIKIKVQKSTPPPAVAIGHLKGTARKLAELIVEHADYEFEGFTWLSGTFGGIVEQLSVNEKTIARNAQKPPFHYIPRQTSEDGKHILLKLGTEPCETDHVYRLRAIWVRGPAYFNGAAANVWPMEVMKAKHAKLPYKRLLKRIEEAQKWAPMLDKLKAGKPISYTVQPHEMGLLRECVKNLGDDAFPTITCLTSWNGGTSSYRTRSSWRESQAITTTGRPLVRSPATLILLCKPISTSSKREEKSTSPRAPG